MDQSQALRDTSRELLDRARRLRRQSEQLLFTGEQLRSLMRQRAHRPWAPRAGTGAEPPAGPG